MAEYDEFAAEYQTSKQLPFRVYAEAPLLQELIGDVTGKDVLDLACGEGIYSRKLKSLGARQVMGIDISSEMIALAKAREEQAPQGISYFVGDASNVAQLGSFDIVLGSYLLNYARSPEHLAAFCRAIRRNLKVGGRFVGINDNPANAPQNYSSYRKYGFIKSTSTPRQEGDPIRYTMYLDDGKEFSFDNYYLAPQTYERSFADAGFRSFKWRTPKIAQAGVDALGNDYWSDFIKDAPVIGMEAEL